MVGFLALCVAWMAWIFGLSAPEAALGFLEEATLRAVGATPKLGLIALGFAVIAAFGRWCQLQARLRLDPPLLSRVIRFLSAPLAFNIALNRIHRILSSNLTVRLHPLAGSRLPVSTYADLAGATPLLN